MRTYGDQRGKGSESAGAQDLLRGDFHVVSRDQTDRQLQKSMDFCN
jgi:hypothetical protein